MLLHVVAGAADAVDPPTPRDRRLPRGLPAARRGRRQANPGAVARLLAPAAHRAAGRTTAWPAWTTERRPISATWPLSPRRRRSGWASRFEIDVPVRDGRVPLPGLGCLEAAGAGRVGQAQQRRRAPAGRPGTSTWRAPPSCPTTAPAAAVPHWRGTPLVRAVADGQAWEVLLETADRYLDRYTLPMLTAMTAGRGRELAAAASSPPGNCSSAITSGQPGRSRRASPSSSRSCRGPTWTARRPRPPSAPSRRPCRRPRSSMAETLVHEFQHIKLCGLMDMLPLIEPSGERGYAPWREDPRPMGGLLQGVYAFTGIVRFWDVQRRLETEPDDVLRASVLYERWRLAIELVTGTLLDKRLPHAGRRSLRHRAQGAGTAPGESEPRARPSAIGDRPRGRPRQLADLAAQAYGGRRRRRSPAWRTPTGAASRSAAGAAQRPGSRTTSGRSTPSPRSRLLNMRYQEPQRYRQLAGDGPARAQRGRRPAGPAGTRARRWRPTATDSAAEPDPAAWIGLALAIHRLPATPSRPVFASRLPLLFEMHACLAGQGIHADPLDLAAWFA